MRNEEAGNTQCGWAQGNQNFNLSLKNNLFLIAFSNKVITKIFVHNNFSKNNITQSMFWLTLFVSYHCVLTIWSDALKIRTKSDPQYARFLIMGYKKYCPTRKRNDNIERLTLK